MFFIALKYNRVRNNYSVPNGNHFFFSQKGISINISHKIIIILHNFLTSLNDRNQNSIVLPTWQLCEQIPRPKEQPLKERWGFIRGRCVHPGTARCDGWRTIHQDKFCIHNNPFSSYDQVVLPEPLLYYSWLLIEVV